MQKPNYTAIEIIVVILTVEVVSCLVIPFFSKTYVNSDKLDYSNTVKQLAITQFMYALDNDKKLPMTSHLNFDYQNNSTKTAKEHWQILVDLTYQEEYSIWGCRAQSPQAKTVNKMTYFYTTHNLHESPWAAQTILSGDQDGANGKHDQGDENINHPGKYKNYLFLDGHTDHVNN